MRSSLLQVLSLVDKAPKKAVAIALLARKDYPAWLQAQPRSTSRWLESIGFQSETGKSALVPGKDHELERVVCIVERLNDPWGLVRFPSTLPLGCYQIETALTPEEATRVALGWGLGSYQFERYKAEGKKLATLVWPENADRGQVTRELEGVRLCRDLINTPASDMGPQELAAAGRELARRHRAQVTVIQGEALLRRDYPMIYAVGKASPRAPLLFDMRWGNPKHPKLTLIGKGVCFDSGGLDLKSPDNMKLMKKDMGGAAAVLGLAHVVMGDKLPVRLRVLIPAVENSVSGNAFRPLDVLNSRKGIRVEVGNTDAEGRLVLADAITEAISESPELVIDMATLTGAARVALGTALPALFCNQDALAEATLDAGRQVMDPFWRLPLHRPYREQLSSLVADIGNISNSSFGGAITAALFLEEFVGTKQAWIHVDTMGWNSDSQPGRPVGGEALGVRALAEMLRARFGSGRAGASAGRVKQKAARSTKKKRG